MKIKQQPSAIKLDEVSTIIRPMEWGLTLIFVIIFFLLLMWGIFGQISHRVETLGVIGLEGSQSFLIDAPTSGFMGPIHIKKGDLVQKGTSLMEIISVEKTFENFGNLKNLGNKKTPSHNKNNNKKATFNYHEVLSPIKAKVTDILTEPGKHLSKKQPILRLQTAGRQPEVHLYLSLNTYKQVRVGQEVLVKLNHAEDVKTFTGVIKYISRNPIHQRDTTPLPQSLRPLDPVYKSTVVFDQNFSPFSKELGFTWHVPTKKEEVFISAGNLVQTSILVKKQKPIAMIIPFFN